MTYNKRYYEQNKERISSYNKTRRLENPGIVEKEKKAYQLKVDDFKMRSKIQNLKRKIAWEMLNKDKQSAILLEVSKRLGVE